MLPYFFILGNPRSGTTLLRLLLNAHSKISVPPECGFALWLYPNYKDWSLNDLTESKIEDFLIDLLNTKKFETWQLGFETLKKCITRIKPNNYESLIQCVYLTYAEKYNKHPKIIGDKNNYFINELDTLDKAFKNKLVVHIVRDGRDVAASYRKLKKLDKKLKYRPNLPSEIESIAEEWNINNLRILERYGNKQNYYLIRYEDLLSNPEKRLSQLLHFLELSYEPEMMQFDVENRKMQIEPKETILWKMKTLQPLDASNKGGFKKELSKKEILAFNSLAYDSLKQFKYVD